MAKVYTGRDGIMRHGNNTIAKVVSFQVSSSLDVLETTTLGENVRHYTPGIVGYTGTATLLYYKNSSNSINTTSLLNKLYKTGGDGVSANDTVDLTFRWKDGSDENDIKMNAYITSASIGAATGEIVRAEISFQATGELSTASI